MGEGVAWQQVLEEKSNVGIFENVERVIAIVLGGPTLLVCIIVVTDLWILCVFLCF